MRLKVGDIITIKHYTGKDLPTGYYYLITKTRSRFRYEVIFLPDGCPTQLDKSYVAQYGVKVA